MKIDGGYILWARKTIESDLFVWRSDVWFKIWFFIINKVNYKDTRHFLRGEGLMTYRDIRRGTGSTQGQVDKFIRYAKREMMLTTRKTTRGMIIKVLNYHKYQLMENYQVDKKVERIVEMKSKRSRNEVDTITERKIKNEKNDISSEQGSQGNILGKIIYEFRNVNPSYEKFYGNKTQRAALQRLVDKYTEEKVLGFIAYLPIINADKYAKGKSISPLELENNLAHIVNHYKQKSGDKPKIRDIS